MSIRPVAGPSVIGQFIERELCVSKNTYDVLVIGGGPGGYVAAIRAAQFPPVETADGCICSVIGLPLWTTRRLLRAAAGIETAEPGYERCAACPLRKP